jgi:hypothetical protein
MSFSLELEETQLGMKELFVPDQRYDDHKRRFPIVHSDEYVRIHDNYDRIRAVGHPFGRNRITAVKRSYFDVHGNIQQRLLPYINVINHIHPYIKRESMRPPPKIKRVGCRKILIFEMS